MAARLLLRSLRVLSARSATLPPPSARCSHSGAEARLETPSAKKLTDIGIRRIFSSEHDIFRESVRKFFQEEVIPYHEEWEKAGEVSRELWEKAGKQGLLGINIAEKHGGIGGDLLSTAVTWEEQAYSNCTGPGFSLHSDIVMPYIANYGTKEQIEQFIPQMTAGKCIGAIAMTEPGAGSDLQGVRTNAKRSGSDWILNGSKVFITNGWLSDLVIVVAVTNREARPTLESPRIEITSYLGLHHGSNQFFHDVEVEDVLPSCKRSPSTATLHLPSLEAYRDPSCLSPASSLSSRSCNSEASSYESNYSYPYASPQTSPWQSPCVSPKTTDPEEGFPRSLGACIQAFGLIATYQ